MEATCTLLTLFSVLLGLKQYFGDPIECSTDGVEKPSFMEKYCWVEGTFTVYEYALDSARGAATNPGIGQRRHHHTALSHSYYQWVPLVLGMAGASFYAPRYLWKIFEGGLMKNICEKLKFETEEKKME